MVSSAVGRAIRAGREKAPVPGILLTAARALLEDFPFLAIVAAYTGFAGILHVAVGVPANFDFTFSWNIVAASTALFGSVAFFAMLSHEVVIRSNSLYSAGTWRNAVGRAFPPYKTLRFAVFFLAFPLFAETFTACKVAIATLHPFGAWDVRFMEWDRLLHFGQHPWVLLQPLLGHPPITRVLDFVYVMWFPVIWITLLSQAWHGSIGSQVRSQFMLAFLLCWILLGNLLAVALSSAGPVFYEGVTGLQGPYDGLLAYLLAADEQFSIGAVRVQRLLWEAYQNSTLIEFGGGISAMPSLHIAMTTLLVLFGFRVDRRLGWAYVVFAFLMFLGSVHLAWHYAIDGYVGAGGAVAVWLLSGWIVRNWHRNRGRTATPSAAA